MKRFFAVVALSFCLMILPLQARYSDTTIIHTTQSSSRGMHSEADAVASGVVAAIVLSVAGLYYLASCCPSSRLSVAQKTYNSLDPDWEKIIDCVACYEVGDLANYAARIYPWSPYPLVETFNFLHAVYTKSQEAIRELNNALWWTSEASFVRTCKNLIAQLEKRVDSLQKVMAKLSAHEVWKSQYSLYLQKCNNDRLERIETSIMLQGLNNHCGHHDHHYYNQTTVIV